MNFKYTENGQDDFTSKYLDFAVMELPKELIEFADFVSNFIDDPHYYSNGDALLREFILSREKNNLRELMLKYPGSIICPTCNGNGKIQNDNITEQCTTCNGHKIVMPQEKIITEYIPIGE